MTIVRKPPTAKPPAAKASVIDPPQAKPASPLELQPRTTAATLGGSIATIAIIVLQANGVDVTAELAAAIATISAAISAWLPSR